MVKKFFISCFLLLLLSFSSRAGKVDTVNIYSSSMNKTIKCIVIKPNSYKKNRPSFPVVYLLHGYSGNFRDWIKKVPEISNYADQFNTIIVCPDGGFSSWYFDSPIDSTSKYETFVATEVVNFIDANYRTLPYSYSRAITGLSMGGHGALYLAFRHQHIFGAVGSMSGGVDLKESKNRFEISKRIGDTISHANDWYYRSVIGMIDTLNFSSIKISFECGVNDFFIGGNRLLHKKLLEHKIPHDYTERPGEHNWEYWKNAILYQLTFFDKCFKTSVFINGG